MTTISSSSKNAGVFKRLIAITYDSFLLIGLFMVYSAIILWVNVEYFHIVLAPGEKATMGPLQTLGIPLICIGFFCLFWTKQGQTLGMQAWKIQLVNQQGQTPTLTECLLRLVYAAISIGCFGLGYWWIWLDKDRLTWHDRWSKTRVIQVNRSK